MDIRKAAIDSKAKVRLITGNPGVGKTYFGCQIAEYEFRTPGRGVDRHQKILCLTFARNAVARIRQAYHQQISNDASISEGIRDKRISEFNARVKVNTFAGFFWWLIGSYGRYLPGNSTTCRPWFVGAKRTGIDSVPANYKGYTFDDLEEEARLALQVKGIQNLISDIYPLIIVDEFQDVDTNLLEVLDLLRQNSRLVLLCGPGQCIYRGLKDFDPEMIMHECNKRFNPAIFKLEPKSANCQRYCSEISAMISEYENGLVSPKQNWPIYFEGIERKTKKDLPKELETQVGLLLLKMKGYLTRKAPQRAPSLCILASTNQGVSELYKRLLKGSTSYSLRPLKVNLHFDDTLLLQYGRLILSLLRKHWISFHVSDSDDDRIGENLVSLFKAVKSDKNDDVSAWNPLVSALIDIVRCQVAPRKNLTKQGFIEKLIRDIESINKILRAKKTDLPEGSPQTPLTSSDNPLLETLSHEFIKSIDTAFNAKGRLSLKRAESIFEKSMQKRIIFEKLGIENGVQVMTIHKSKGREFDGVILVLEDNLKALWKKNSKSTDSELNDLYRVGISRAKEAFGLIAYNDAYNDAKPSAQKLLDVQLFRS